MLGVSSLRVISRLCPSASTGTSFLCRHTTTTPQNSQTADVSFASIRQELSAAKFVTRWPKAAQPYLRIMRVDKPAGTWLLYWPCTWSIALATPAGQLPSVYMLALFGAGSFFMRSAGCVINDLWDKDYDKMMRPLASGELSSTQAVGLLAGLLSTSLGILLQLNWFSVAVGASSMLLVIGYPLAKRYTYWPQFVLGATLNWGVLIAWSALLPPSQLPLVAPLYISTVLHTVIYDTIYSHQSCTGLLANLLFLTFEKTKKLDSL